MMTWMDESYYQTPKLMRHHVLLILLIFTGYVCHAQQVTDFTLVNAMNGRDVSLKDYSSNPGVLIIFISNSCAYDEYYLGRIKKLTQDYNARVPVLLVNSNANELPASMQKRGEQCGFTVPYLADKNQTLMQQLDASKNPESILLKNSAGQFTVFYRGAIDDNPQVESDVRVGYLKNALDALLSGKPVQNKEVRPMGCTIRKN